MCRRAGGSVVVVAFGLRRSLTGSLSCGLQEGRRGTRTVHVRNISDLAGEREVREFLSFSGEIEHVDISP
ncbi:unnamed protein product [Triticum turgidum subsp. durum]|uniref:RRM domain-containing protein n=1 Tax=Triticum turgidum subsp. durum TaxID=4567 RepID=A0A9R1QZT9_TRITD|nr:unnamed protein product [Triticum turgidum subsp. durum]